MTNSDTTSMNDRISAPVANPVWRVNKRVCCVVSRARGCVVWWWMNKRVGCGVSKEFEGGF